MKILILSRDANYYSTKRLVAEARKLRHQAAVIDPLACDLSLGSRFTLNAANLPDLSAFDVVIPRIGILGIDYALLVAHQLEFMGKPLLNSARSLDYAKNKFLALQILSKSGIPVPNTMMTHTLEHIDKTIKQLGGLPVVLKLFRGSQGKGVMLAENRSSAESILTAVWAIGFDILLQNYIKETKGSDIRVFVLNNEIIAAMQRIPAQGDFRSNIHQGGRMKKVTLTNPEKYLALRAAKALGLKLAGVDLMRTKKGPIVLEVNASPGFEGLEKITGINIARKIVEYACRLI